MRPGDPPTEENARSLILATFFDSKRYDLAKVGRYKYNKKLGIASRLAGCVPAEDIVDPVTGEILAEAGNTVTREQALEIENAGVEAALVHSLAGGDELTKIIGNNFY